MVHLYQFWADFLRDYWVPSMYSEFVRVAQEDANLKRRTGLGQLYSLYERKLESKFRMSLWNDFIRLAGIDYRNGYFTGIERVWRIRGALHSRGAIVYIPEVDVRQVVEMEIKQPSDLDRLRKETKPAPKVLVDYSTVPTR
jgi:la-related protein 1